ncbi:MAG TPA: cation transporter [Thermoleophilia bacterium]|nr:cation transporter [Thermoleophilia bacterium]
MGADENEYDEAAELERRTLLVLLGINGALFVVEAVAGWIGQATGLVADSLDMLADAFVYAIALSAVGRSRRLQSNAAAVSGVLQIALGLLVVADVARRLLAGSEPVSLLIVGIGLVALAANLTCLALISKHREGGIHMRASWIFSANDVIANIGVIVAGVLVWLLGSRIPDLVIGAAIAVVVIRGGVKILLEVRTEKAEAGSWTH